eukprot:132174-Lingulodinium_polyedra.AAC.1
MQATWSSGLFARLGVVSATARPGAGRGPQGGVAILFPAPWAVTRQQTLVPGCAVAAWASHPRDEAVVVFVSLYLPPGQQLP